MKRFLCILLSLTMLLSLSCVLGGCQNAQPLIIGTWTANIDGADIIRKSFEDGLGEDAAGMKDYFIFSKYTLVQVVTFRADGTYIQYVTESSINVVKENLKKDITKGLSAYYMDVFKEAGLSGTVNGILEELTGSTLEQMVDTIFSTAFNEELEKDFGNREGRYKLEDGKIYYSMDTETEPEDKYYDTYEVNSDQLTFHACFCEIDEQSKEYNDMLYPMVFTRHN